MKLTEPTKRRAHSAVQNVPPPRLVSENEQAGFFALEYALEYGLVYNV